MTDNASSIVLCKKLNNYTIAHYIEDCKNGNKRKMADFIFERFNERYIEPFEAIKDKKKRNGFCLMAISCLMIEALETFYQGLKDSRKDKNNKKIDGGAFFEAFFSHCKELTEFKGRGLIFYKNIRCGILHQAETKGGWKISRMGKDPLLNINGKTINATKFFNQLKKYLESYRKDLETQDLNNSIWINFKEKMEAIINNCQG